MATALNADPRQRPGDKRKEGMWLEGLLLRQWTGLLIKGLGVRLVKSNSGKGGLYYVGRLFSLYATDGVRLDVSDVTNGYSGADWLPVGRVLLLLLFAAHYCREFQQC